MKKNNLTKAIGFKFLFIVTVFNAGFILFGDLVNLATDENLSADCGGFKAGKNLCNLHDGATVTSVANRAPQVWMEYSFGRDYTLSGIGIFGEDEGNWVSTTWDFQCWDGNRFVDVFKNEDCRGAQWFLMPIDIKTSKVRVTVNGKPAGTEVYELKIFGDLDGSSGNLISSMSLTPDQFTFVDHSGVQGGTYIVSDPVTITGTVNPVFITVDGGEYSINNGDFTADLGMIRCNDRVRVKVLSSEKCNTTVSATLDVGGITDQFDVTTEDAVALPLVVGALIKGPSPQML